MDSGTSPVTGVEVTVNVIWSSDVSRGGRTGGLGAEDGSVVLLDVDNGRVLTIPQAHQRQVWCVRW